jgi:fused signal recognition particle receptor
MEELVKIKRVMKKVDERAPTETLLVVDATQGQNALNQAREFHRAIDLSGLVVTKLDGTAKGGIIFAISHELKLPIRFIGVGESIDDLKEFKPKEFVHALLADGDTA